MRLHRISINVFVIVFLFECSSSFVVVADAFSPSKPKGNVPAPGKSLFPLPRPARKRAFQSMMFGGGINGDNIMNNNIINNNKNGGDNNDDDDDVNTIQILMSDTGGGHRASAKAISDALEVLHPGKFECEIVDLYTDYGGFFPVNAYVSLYKIMATHSWMWRWFYAFGTTSFGLWLYDFLLETFCFRFFKRAIARPCVRTKKRADMVVSVHPLCQDTPLKILASLDTNGASRTKGRTTPFATVVTDLGSGHPLWFNPRVDKCFVPSDILNKCARGRGLNPSQIIQYGLPIRKGFWGSPPGNSTEKAAWQSRGGGSGKDLDTLNDSAKNALRSKLGLQKGIPTVLVVGGGDGLGGIVDQARAIGNRLSEEVTSRQPGTSFQMVVVCGKNAKAKKALSTQKWGDGVHVIVNGFVNNMEEWMRASDALVTKAGPGTIAEASICGLPCALSSFLPGQEVGNIPFVEDAGFGKYNGKPKDIAETVASWLASSETLKQMKAAALEASRPSATLDIAKDLAEMMFAHKKKAKEEQQRQQQQQAAFNA